MHPDLVHAASEGPTHHDARHAIIAQPLKLCPTLLAMAGHLAHSDLVAHNFDRLSTLRLALWELAFNSAHILLQYLPGVGSY